MIIRKQYLLVRHIVVISEDLCFDVAQGGKCRRHQMRLELTHVGLLVSNDLRESF